MIRQQADLIVHTDSRSAQVATKILGPTAPKLAEQYVSQMEMFFSALPWYIHRHPEKAEELIAAGAPGPRAAGAAQAAVAAALTLQRQQRGAVRQADLTLSSPPGISALHAPPVPGGPIMVKTLPPPQVLRCYFDDAFTPRLPAMCLRWDAELVGGERLWELPEGVTLVGPPPERFGVSISRRGSDSYNVRVLWDRTCLTWDALPRTRGVDQRPGSPPGRHGDGPVVSSGSTRAAGTHPLRACRLSQFPTKRPHSPRNVVVRSIDVSHFWDATCGSHRGKRPNCALMWSLAVWKARARIHLLFLPLAVC